VIHNMARDKANNFWLSTNHGIVRFLPGLRQWSRIAKDDGLYSGEFNEGALYLDEDNNVYAGSNIGLTICRRAFRFLWQAIPAPILPLFLLTGSQPVWMVTMADGAS
ncbi:MAG: hypothetical protein HC896_14485, partial [Bacteroidales bacterium]|nr:hypothetical protein [Bacteroidales bacterium]